MTAISPAIGGGLIRGEKGTAKSTAVRGLTTLLPEIDVVPGCPYSCDPENTAHLCPHCSERVVRGDTLLRTRRRVRIVELPVGATEDRVIGTLDLEQAKADLDEEGYPVASTEQGFTVALPKGGFIPLTGK